jgi:hypothetical protein
MSKFVRDVPDVHPLSLEWINYWQWIKESSIVGDWVQGEFIPPSLFFYGNMGTIKLNKSNSNIKSFARPLLRDLDWKVHHYYNACRGFSGFKNDDTFTANYRVLDDLFWPIEKLRIEFPDVINSDGERKIFRHPITLLQERKEVSMGAALFQNNMWNGMVLGSRDSGKSYLTAGIVAKEWLLDGQDRLDMPAEEITSVDITVGAEESSKSALLLAKVKDMLDRLPGERFFNKSLKPSPLRKRYKGSFNTGSNIEATYQKKYDGGWKDAGSGSVIKHRSFKDDAFKDQGARNLILVLEEIGLFKLLKEVHANTKDNLKSGPDKTGILWMLGTGGDMEGGTLPAQEMFYNPGHYQIFEMPDTWENSGAIAYFIPAQEAMNQYKDDNLTTKYEEATAYLTRVRTSLTKSGTSSDALNKEIQYRPMVPSEIFLSRESVIFPSGEIQNRLTEVNNKKILELFEKKVELYFDPSEPYGVGYKVNNKLNAINDFPYTSPDIEGAPVIYELPIYQGEAIRSDSYIIAYDAFKANTNTGSSLAAIIVMKTNKYPTQGFSEIVAVYYGRPYMGIDAVNEILYKLSLFYGNAKIYFENTAGNTKDYFQRLKRLDLLAVQPRLVLSKKTMTSSNLVYGYPMSNDKIKWEALQYARSWLLEDRGDNIKNIDLIMDRYLLKQLKAFNLKGNFDAVMAFVGCIIGLEDMASFTLTAIEKTQASQYEQDISKFITQNAKIFKTTPIISGEDYERF